MNTQRPDSLIGDLVRMRKSRIGQFILKVIAGLCLLIVLGPSILTIVLGTATGWFKEFAAEETFSYSLTSLLEAYIRAPNDIFSTILTAFPPIAFCLAYAGRRNISLTLFGGALLMILLLGVFVGVGLSIFINSQGGQLACSDTPACMGWLSNRCAESGRQCLTYFLLLLGFDRLSGKE